MKRLTDLGKCWVISEAARCLHLVKVMLEPVNRVIVQGRVGSLAYNPGSKVHGPESG
jgi:hypothetical protein